jgi:hypothetical protein
MRDYDSFSETVKRGRRFLVENRAATSTGDYPAIRGWFSAQSEWTADTARIGSLMIYGWMPTILRTEKTDFEQFAGELNDLKLGVKHEIGQPFVNASWVGTSKFLHFLKPDQWAIWDSRVCTALGWGSSPNDKGKFSEYQEFCRRFALGNEGVSLREIEQCLYLLDKKKLDGQT